MILLLLKSSCPDSGKVVFAAFADAGITKHTENAINNAKTIDHVEYCRKVYADGYSTAYTVGVLFDSLEYAKTATEIKIVDQIDGIPVTEAGIEFCKQDFEMPRYDCYNTKISEDTENLEKRYIAYDSYTNSNEDIVKIEKQIGAKVEKVTIPDSIKTIPAECFAFMKNIKTVSLPKNLEKLGQCAFMNCTALESVVFKGDKVTEIPWKAFQNCKALATVKFNKNKIEKIDAYAFNNCKSLKKINLPSSLLSIAGCAFEKSGLETITIPKNVYTPRYYFDDYLGYTFRDCKSLKKVTYTGKDVFIGGGEFDGCDNLQEINLKKAKYVIALYGVVSTKKEGVLKINTENKAVAYYIADALRTRNTDYSDKKLECKKIKIYVGEQLVYNIPKEKYSGKLPNLSASATLKTGSNSKNVAKLKKFLNWAIGSNLEINNKFDTSTAKAVKKFQNQCGLKATGVFGAAELKKAKVFEK